MFRFVFPLILILSVTSFYSCSDPAETPDTKAPEITLNGVSENQRVKGVITIAATAEDVSKRLSMEVFLDGNLLGESASKEISVEADTKTLTEGPHTIKITATDKTGNNSEKIFNIEVRNTLFIVHVSSNYVEEYNQIYFALSRNDGSLINVFEVDNGTTVSIPTPTDFNPDSSFVFTEYFYFYQPAGAGNIETLIRSTNISAGLHAGEFFLREYPTSQPIVGTHHVTVTNVPTSNYTASLLGNNTGSIAGNFGGSGIIDADLGLRNNTSDLFFELEVGSDGVPVYNYINNIQTGGSTAFSISGLPQMPKVDVTTSDVTGGYWYSVYNVDPNNIIRYVSREGILEGGKIPVYYPSTSYPQYAFDMDCTGASGEYENRITGATPPSSFQYLNANVSNVNYLNRKLKVTSSGTFDILTISGVNSVYNGTLFKLDVYNVSFPSGTKSQVTLPNTPSELLSFEFTSPSSFSFTSAYITDYPELSGPSDYQSKIVFSAGNLHRQFRDFISRTIQITPTNSGGRLSIQQKMILPKNVETILRNRFLLKEF